MSDDATKRDLPARELRGMVETRAIEPTGRYRTRSARPGELEEVGRLMVAVYAALDGFPKASEQPVYYEMLAGVGKLTERPDVEILVAVDASDAIAGAVVYFGDMRQYGSGGTATSEREAAGFRLLAVADAARGRGLGKLLTRACIEKAKAQGRTQVVIHTTKAMKAAWAMYEKMGFRRSEDLDFMQEALPVFGFRLALRS